MIKYIPKDAVVAEIDKKIYYFKDYEDRTVRNIACNILNKIKQDINSLEVKEVDLENIVAVEWDDYVRKIDGEPNAAYMLIKRNEYIELAKHFFELGLKAQNDNIRHSMDELPKYPCDILLVTNVDNMFLCRYVENGRPVDRETPYFHNIENGKCWYYCNDIMNIH